MFLKKPCIKVKKKIRRRNFELNNNENKTYQEFWDALKAVLTDVDSFKHLYFLKRCQIKKLRKESKVIPKGMRRK